MKKDQMGFSGIGLILVIVVVGLIGFIGYQVFKTNESQKTEANKTTITANKETDKTATPVVKGSEPSSDLISNETPLKPDYDATAAKGNVKLEIRPKIGAVGTKVEYRLAGLTYALEDNLQMFFVDSSGYHRSLAAFSMAGSREDSVRIPEKVFACELGQNCTDEIATAKGTGKLVVTHSNDFIEDISIGLEIK